MSNTQYSNMRFPRSLWAMIAAASFTMMGVAAQGAEPGDAPPQKVVSYRDLDLRSDKGVAALYARIQRAASEVCGNFEQLQLQHLPAVRACIDQAASRSIAEVGNPALSSLYLAKTGKSVIQVASLKR